MSISTISVIMDRIKAAKPSSPIAVFLVGHRIEGDSRFYLDACFASTVETQKLIDGKCPALVGVYHRNCLESHVMDDLRTAYAGEMPALETPISGSWS